MLSASISTGQRENWNFRGEGGHLWAEDCSPASRRRLWPWTLHPKEATEDSQEVERDVTDRQKRATDLPQQRDVNHVCPRDEKHGELWLRGEVGEDEREEGSVVTSGRSWPASCRFSQPTAPWQFHRIFRDLLLASPEVICIWVNIFNWPINGITKNLLKGLPISFFQPEY